MACIVSTRRRAGRLTLPTILQDPQSTGSNEVISTGQDRSGVFWIGLGNRLERFDRASGKVTMRTPLPQSRLLFHEDRFGVFWLTYLSDAKVGNSANKN